jgi:hypothetical protein
MFHSSHTQTIFLLFSLKKWIEVMGNMMMIARNVNNRLEKFGDAMGL